MEGEAENNISTVTAIVCKDVNNEGVQSTEESVIRVSDRMGIKITIEMDDGRKNPLVVRVDDKIIDVMDKIQKTIRVDNYENILVYNEDHLEDNRIIKDYSIADGDVIKVVPRKQDGMEIYVQIRPSKKIAVEVAKNTMISEIKEKVLRSTGLSEGDLDLEYDGYLLEEDKTVYECKVYEKSVIDVTYHDMIQLFAKISPNRSIPFNVTNKYTILDVKKAIEATTKILSEELQIRYKENLLNDDDITIQSFNIVENSDIDVVVKPMDLIEIIVRTMDGREKKLSMSKYNKILELKNKIHEITGISPAEQKLNFVDEDMVLEDEVTIQGCGFSEGKVINVDVGQLKIVHAITHDGKVFEFVMSLTDRVADLKKAIYDKLGIEIHKQIITYNEQILEDNETIAGCKLSEKCGIKVEGESKGFHILIMTQEKRRISLNVQTNCRIADVKLMIEKKTKIPKDKLVLKLEGRMIKDDVLTLHELRIKENSQIELLNVSTLFITILSPDMESIPLEILNSDKIIDVKRKIYKILRLPYADQILELDGQLLDDTRCICDYDIRSNQDVSTYRTPKKETRGICLIINNEIYDNIENGESKNRHGTRKDEENITKTFEPLGYKIEIRRDVTSAGITDVINETKEMVSSSHKIFIVFVLSHGSQDRIETTNGSILFTDIWGPYKNDIFYRFAGKPKLFFFASCQGKKYNNAVQVDGEPLRTAPKNTTVPEMADIFLGYSTCESYFSFRHKEEGTFYVKSMCEVIQKYPQWSITDIHMEVQTRLGNTPFGEGNQQHFQMPHCDNRLRENVYLVDR